MTTKKSKFNSLKKSFENFQDVYPLNQIDKAMNQKDLLIPYLINNLTAEIQNDNNLLPENVLKLTTAVVLLDELKINIYEPLLELLSMPGEAFSMKLGGGISEDYLAALLFRNAMGRLEPLYEMVLDKNVSPVNRSLIIIALAFHVLIAQENLDEIEHIFKKIPLSDNFEPQSSVLSTWARFGALTFPKSIAPTVKKFVEEDYIADYAIHDIDFEMIMKEEDPDYIAIPIIEHYDFGVSMHFHTRLQAFYEFMNPPKMERNRKKVAPSRS